MPSRIFIGHNSNIFISNFSMSQLLIFLFQKSMFARYFSLLKQLGQMEPNLARSIYVRSKPGIDGPWVCPFQNCVLHSRQLLFFKVMIISLWNLLQYHSIVRWAIQAQCAEPLVFICKRQIVSYMEGGAVGHNFERDTPRDHLCQVWTLHRCFLPSLAPFGQAVSEEKIFF
jgi:hypothetical protein